MEKVTKLQTGICSQNFFWRKKSYRVTELQTPNFQKKIPTEKSYRVTELQGYRPENFPMVKVTKLQTQKNFPQIFRRKKVTELQSYRATDRKFSQTNFDGKIFPKKFPTEKKLQSYRVTGLQTRKNFRRKKKLQSYRVTGLQTQNFRTPNFSDRKKLQSYRVTGLQTPIFFSQKF